MADNWPYELKEQQWFSRCSKTELKLNNIEEYKLKLLIYCKNIEKRGIKPAELCPYSKIYTELRLAINLKLHKLQLHS